MVKTTAALLLGMPLAAHAGFPFMNSASSSKTPPKQNANEWKIDDSADKAFFTNSDLPNNEWSLDEDGSGFMAAADPEAIEFMQNYQRERRASSSTNSYHYRDYFVDGSETFWPEGAQAWRLLGFYIDCYDQEQGYQERRNLQGEENNQQYESGACVRYLLWAAYIDVYYEGGGIGEYMYWDNDYNGWNTAACDEMSSYDNDDSVSRRCAKMDCHLRGSDHFKLLGFFKEPNFAQFYEQLFKHQGICVWDDDTYEFMQTMRELWPQGCTYSGVSDSRGNYLYFDVKPLENADITVGLYTDARCSQDYRGNEDMGDVLTAYSGYQQGNNNDRNGDNGNLGLGDLIYYIDYWNEAMKTWKQCQPCKAYNLYAEYEQVDECNEVEKNDDYYKNMYGRYWYYYEHYGEPDDDYWQAQYENLYGVCEDNEDDYSNDDSQGHFTCEDDAGYKNVNQCMKFSTHTKMMAATFRDILIGANQGTIKPVYVGRFSLSPGEGSSHLAMGAQWRAYDFLAVGFASVFFIGSAFVLCQAWRRLKEVSPGGRLKAPLVPATSGDY